MSTPAPHPWSRKGLALLGFVGHAPGLKLLARARFSRRFVRVNLVAVGLTLAAMALAGIVAPSGAGGRWVFLVWLALHFAWSTILSAWILGGDPFAPATGSSAAASAAAAPPRR